ncbi:MAG: DNA polymerase III subunit delta [Chloroflexi bacterium RBG_16_57_11]|nr:MAG: DNA polymerase III subunit delta [Chloroflexi bacterium RBG_16_57_11]
MGELHPVIYLLNGEDEFSIARFVDELERKLGDPATASMNTTRLDGNTFNLDQLPSVANALPFLAPRRLVILNHPIARLSTPAAQKSFTDQLEKIPPTTALVLIEDRLLTLDKDREKGKLHWLERWALEHKDRVYLRAFRAPKGPEMVKRIQEGAKKGGGQITTEAAMLLASLVDNDPRLADQETEKLLAFVNYRRPIEYDDVEAVTADTGQGDIFTLVDALGSRDGTRAMGMLQRLLEYQDYYAIFGMIVRQFRLLIQARESLDLGKHRAEIQHELRLHPYVAEKLLGQAQRFTLPELERVYRRLIELDEAVKTSQMPERLALETFVSAITASQQPQPSR